MAEALQLDLNTAYQARELMSGKDVNFEQENLRLLQENIVLQQENIRLLQDQLITLCHKPLTTTPKLLKGNGNLLSKMALKRTKHSDFERKVPF